MKSYSQGYTVLKCQKLTAGFPMTKPCALSYPRFQESVRTLSPPYVEAVCNSCEA